MAGDYQVADVRDALPELPTDEFAVVALDDAWARPRRGNEFGVTYPTHDFDGTAAILDECRRVLKPGGWLIADADAWLLPRLLDYLRETWGDAAETYRAGYRTTGYVRLETQAGDTDRSTPGQYLSTGGYPVAFAHKGETSRRTTVAAVQSAPRPRERYGWGSVKPIRPYKRWLQGLTVEGERVLVPCAGTAPAAIAAEQTGRDWLAIDCERGARDAYERRRAAVLDDAQTLLSEAVT